MNLDRVTITGADDSIDPLELYFLSMDFPFVEWGVLASASNTDGPRFPSLDWMYRFRELVSREGLKSSLHLCGRWVRSLLVGEIDPIIFKINPSYARIQLNFHAERSKCEPAKAMQGSRCFVA